MQNITKFFFFTKTIYWSSTRNICCYCICRFCWYNIHNSFNFIARNHWSISNTFWIFTIPSNTCARIPTIIFYPLMIIFKFTLTCFIFLFWFELHVVLLDLHAQSHEIFFVIVLASFSFAITLNALKFMFMFLLENIFLVLCH